MAKIVTFGEIMLRLSTENHERFTQAHRFDACFGGGEANVAVSLAHYGHEAYFVTKLPKNDIGESAIKALRSENVKCDYVVRGGDRIGIYFCEKGCSQRGSQVIYDRAHSSISEMKVSDFNVEEVLKDVTWLHWTGITPALSEDAVKFMRVLLRTAKLKGITVSCDLNFRKKLWTTVEANKAMSELVNFVDVLISNEEDCKDVFGIEATGTDITSGVISDKGYVEIGKQLFEKFPTLSKVAFTLRESLSASENGWSGILIDKDGSSVKSKRYLIQIVDRVGGGDSFGAGLIYGLTHGMSNQETIEYAVAASCLKHTVEGDFNIASVDEVMKLAGGDGSGRVQR